jgi:hypothetical protein
LVGFLRPNDDRREQSERWFSDEAEAIAAGWRPAAIQIAGLACLRATLPLRLGRRGVGFGRPQQ